MSVVFHTAEKVSTEIPAFGNLSYVLASVSCGAPAFTLQGTKSLPSSILIYIRMHVSSWRLGDKLSALHPLLIVLECLHK